MFIHVQEISEVMLGRYYKSVRWKFIPENLFLSFYTSRIKRDEVTNITGVVKIFSNCRHCFPDFGMWVDTAGYVWGLKE